MKVIYPKILFFAPQISKSALLCLHFNPKFKFDTIKLGSVMVVTNSFLLQPNIIVFLVPNEHLFYESSRL
jgi:hypothetical protein